MKYKLLPLFIISLLFSSCAAIFASRKQKTTVTTNDEDAVVYFNNVEFGEGNLIKEKTKKDGVKQVVIQTPGYKDNYKVLIPQKTPVWVYLVQPLNVASTIFGSFVDFSVDHTIKYNKKNNFEIENKYRIRDTTEKYIYLSNIQLNLQNAGKDFAYVSVPFNSSEEKLQTKIDATIEKYIEKYEKTDLEFEKNKEKEDIVYYKDLSKNKSLVFENTIFSYNVYNSLYKSGFYDTTNIIFTDNNNSLLLEGKLNQIYIIKVKCKRDFYYRKSKINMTWYVKNNYGEVLDSIETSEFSGDFIDITKIEKIVADAIDISYIKLCGNDRFTKYIKEIKDFDINEPLLTIDKPKNIIKDKTEATQACVTITNGKKHGSGFIISQNGYILTTYALTVNNNSDKEQEINAITVDGKKYTASVVRYNKFRDIALLKITGTFDKVFEINNEKQFKIFEDIFTIGTPTTIELDHSVSTGVISNERKVLNYNLIQLGMPISFGNSGGPIFNKNGTLEGILISKNLGYNLEGICFAIPSNLIENYLNIKFK